MKTVKELLGARIKELRKDRRLSQEQLAELIGVEPRHISRIEVGENSPTVERLEKIAQALNVPMKDFFDFMHLEDRDTRAHSLEERVKLLSEEYQQIIYKIVGVFER